MFVEVLQPKEDLAGHPPQHRLRDGCHVDDGIPEAAVHKL